MSTVPLMLEKLRISSSHDRLRLFVGSSLSFKCAEVGFESLESAELMAILLSGDVWVCRGNGCALNFIILTNGQPLSQDLSDRLVGGIGIHLRDDLLWSQLSLDASLEIPNNQAGEHNFSLKINHAQQEPTYNESGMRVQSAPGNLRSPPGIPAFELEKIVITMNFKDFPRNDATVPKQYPKFGVNIEDSLYRVQDHDICIDEFDEFDIVNASPALEVGIKSDSDFESLLGEEQDISDEELLFYKSDHINKIPTPPLSTQPSQTSQMDGMIFGEGTGGKGFAGLDLSVACRMTGLALRTLIRGRQHKEQSGLKIWKNPRLTVLAQIAPALWSPGFLEAMSQRSRFLSPIASAFSTSLLRNVQSPSLRRKLQSLQSSTTPEKSESQHPPLSGITIDEQTPLGNATEIYQTLQASLWKMMHQSMYDPKAVHKLKVCAIDNPNTQGNAEDDVSNMIESSEEDVQDNNALDKCPPGVGHCALNLIADDISQVYYGDKERSDDDELLFLSEGWMSGNGEEQFETVLNNDWASIDDEEFKDVVNESLRDYSPMEIDYQEMLV